MFTGLIASSQTNVFSAGDISSSSSYSTVFLFAVKRSGICRSCFERRHSDWKAAHDSGLLAVGKAHSVPAPVMSADFQPGFGSAVCRLLVRDASRLL